MLIEYLFNLRHHAEIKQIKAEKRQLLDKIRVLEKEKSELYSLFERAVDNQLRLASEVESVRNEL